MGSGWKNILNLKDKVRNHICFKIGNGKTTLAWYDKWCLEGPLCNTLTARKIYDARFNASNTVADIIKNGEWCWPAEWLLKYPQLSNIQVPELNEDVCDEAMWVNRAGLKTKYKTKTVWNDIYGNNNGAKAL
ncbi:RNA-directed DNA polymerase, eukaryota, Reverse transcriptase zinc-binding domain protein [Artemisia annua]|uniref:RNA-directed DNA polymerase, eukaryota, Reverse transcriptase zinc-binding domain protein n=1 Tax=Artemisia annua TaxID=35608 RepID=A0A2U1N9L9_ARTAN|nr:RNA-directed DNA polymerase, eukaryota, Reverse transcriptase zinc-binding domain protein [Artemisia annua]